MDDGGKNSCVSLLLALLALCCVRAFAQDSTADRKIDFNLPSDEFPRAILEFYHQSRIEVLFLADDSLNLIYTNPVVGQYTPRDALELMLQGTGLVYTFATNHSVSIKQVAVATPPPRPQALEIRRRPIEYLGHNDLELVTVTGTYIRDAGDVQAPVIGVSSQDLSYAPFPTIQDALYQLPVVSLDAPREDLGINNNFNWGAGINLRGLGVGATLVLVNGRRQPLSGETSDFVDVSNIPAAAVDHIEILPQGASAIYGSDAIAGVVNIILKDHFDGAKTQLHYGGAAGGREDLVISQLLGTHWNSGNVMFVYQYSDATRLAASTRGYAANANKAPYGGGDYRSIFASPGNILDPNTYQPVSGGVSGPVNHENPLSSFDLFPQAVQHSFYGTGKQELGSVELFAEGRFTQRSTYQQSFPQTDTVALGPDNPFNPHPGTTTLVDYSFSQVFGPEDFSDQTQNYVGTVGARASIGRDWQLTLSETYGQERLYSHEYNTINIGALERADVASSASSALNPFGAMSSSLLGSLWLSFPVHAVSGIEDTSLIADGTVLELPSGAVKLAAGMEHREESLSHSAGTEGVPGTLPNYGAYSRQIGSVFSEVSIPIVGDSSSPHAVPRLQLTLAGRLDDYSDFGHTTNPAFGIHWTPTDFLKLRANWGRSYRAPKLDDLYDNSGNVSELALFPDPHSVTGESLILGVQGDNPHLRPEAAKSWTSGFDVVPELDPGLAFSLTYYSILYSGQITLPDSADPVNILSEADEWAPVITRNPTPAQIAAVCNRPDFEGSVTACLTSKPAALINFELSNLAQTDTNGLDINVEQKLGTAVGQFDLDLRGNDVFHFDQKVTASSHSEDILNTLSNPEKLRFRATAGWDQQAPDIAGLGASVALNFTNAYKNPGTPLLPNIRSLTTLDLQLRYHTANNPAGWLGGLDVSLNAVNVFNESPPFVDYIYGYDRESAQPLGRVLGLNVSKQW